MSKEPVDTQSPEAGYFAENAAKLLIDRHCENCGDVFAVFTPIIMRVLVKKVAKFLLALLP